MLVIVVVSFSYLYIVYIIWDQMTVLMNFNSHLFQITHNLN